MSRIRSVHPGLFTDEAFAKCSPLARLLWIGIWTEADDQGIFEWKPFGLRMRLLPGDKVDGEPLLDELTTANMVRSFSHDGRQYGAIRNFGRFQRPKKAKKVHPVPHELRTYLALTDEKEEPKDDEPPKVPHQFPTGSPPTPTSSPPVPHQGHLKEAEFPTSGEKPIQREEGGGRRKEDNLEAQRTSPASRREEFDKIEQACREALGGIAPNDHVIGPMVNLVEQGFTLNSVVSTLISESRRKRSKPIRTWKIWADIVVERVADSPKLNGHAIVATPYDPIIDLGAVKDLQSKIVNAIQKIHRAGYAGWAETEFGSVDHFRSAIAARAPHLMKFWPADAPEKPALEIAK